jgi:DHA2 family multidrug resistance protein
VSHASLAAVLTPFRDALHQPWLPQAWDWHSAAGAAALNSEVTSQAATIAYLNDYSILMWVVLVSAPLLLLLRGPKKVKSAAVAASR